MAIKEGPDEVLHGAAFHLGLQRLPKNLSAGSQLIKQDLHRLEKYLNLQDCLEVLENKICLKKHLKTLKGLEKPLNFTEEQISRFLG